MSAGRATPSSRAPLRRRSALALYEEQRFPNMTPMVDVVMVILIFFMAATTFAGSEWFFSTGVKPPPGTAADGAAAPAPAEDPFSLPPVRLRIDLSRADDGATIASGLGGADAPLEQTLTRLWAFTTGAAADQVVVTIAAAADVPYSDVVRVHEACMAAGVKRVEIGLGH